MFQTRTLLTQIHDASQQAFSAKACKTRTAIKHRYILSKMHACRIHGNNTCASRLLGRWKAARRNTQSRFSWTFWQNWKTNMHPHQEEAERKRLLLKQLARILTYERLKSSSPRLALRLRGNLYNACPARTTYPEIIVYLLPSGTAHWWQYTIHIFRIIPSCCRNYELSARAESAISIFNRRTTNMLLKPRLFAQCAFMLLR